MTVGANSFNPTAPKTSSAAAVATKLLPPSFGLLTPETLLAFCETKLRGIDEQVQRAFLSQQNRNRLSTALSTLSDQLSARSKGIGEGDVTVKDDIIKAYKAAIAEAGPESAVGEKLVEELAHFTATGNGQGADYGVENDTGSIADWEMKDFMDSIQRMQGDVNREGELEMIQLQSLMSQRQQALQMCTNMVASLGQSSQQIAANIGK